MESFLRISQTSEAVVMSEWKSGEPTEDGWYWVSFGVCGVALLSWSEGKFRLWAGDRVGVLVLVDGRWQGPLTPPDPPSSV